MSKGVIQSRKSRQVIKIFKFSTICLVADGKKPVIDRFYVTIKFGDNQNMDFLRQRGKLFSSIKSLDAKIFKIRADNYMACVARRLGNIFSGMVVEFGDILLP